MKSKDWPKLNQEPILNIDATPDAEYPLRILRAYRQNQDCRYATDIAGNCNNPLFAYINECSEKRAKILDKAIAILEKVPEVSNE